MPRDTGFEEEGSWVALPGDQARAATRAWAGIWAKPPAPMPSSSFFSPFDSLPRWPQLPKLTGGFLRSIARGRKVGVAPGPDGWRREELLALPDAAFDELAALLQQVEDGSDWPQELALAHVALLPKGSGVATSGLDKRPIVLLSEIYRLWAAARRRSWTQWALLWDSPSRVAAADQAWDLAAAAVIARSAGQELAGLAIDWSKAYDHVGLAFLGRVLERARVPIQVSRPVLAAYAFKRRVVIAGAVGEIICPTHGIAPGCPLAVDIMALVYAPVDP